MQVYLWHKHIKYAYNSTIITYLSFGLVVAIYNENAFNPNVMDMSCLPVMVDRKRGKYITNDLPQSTLTSSR